MDEQAPVNSLGGETVVETWHGMTRFELEAWAEEKSGESLYIDRLSSDNGNYEADVSNVEASINELLILFGVDPGQWQDRAIKLHRDNSFPQEEHKEYIQRVAGGKSAGQALIDWAEYNLRIEDQEDGLGTVHLVLALSDSVKVIFRSRGDHWSGRHYRDPDNPEKMLSDKWDDERIGKIRDEQGDEYLESLLLEYEVGFLFDCEARFMRPDEPHDVIL